MTAYGSIATSSERMTISQMTNVWSYLVQEGMYPNDKGGRADH